MSYIFSIRDWLFIISIINKKHSENANISTFCVIWLGFTDDQKREVVCKLLHPQTSDTFDYVLAYYFTTLWTNAANLDRNIARRFRDRRELLVDHSTS